VWAYSGTAQIFSVPPIISGTRKATNFKFGRYIHSVYPTKSPLKICEKRERGCIQGRPKFFHYPLLSQERVELRTSNLARIFTGFIPAKASWKFGRKGSIGVSRDCRNFFSTPIISGMGKATKFKFGRYIHRVHANQRHLRIWEKRERWRIQGRPNFFQYPLLSQERVELRTSSLARIFTGFIPAKAF